MEESLWDQEYIQMVKDTKLPTTDTSISNNKAKWIAMFILINLPRNFTDIGGIEDAKLN